MSDFSFTDQTDHEILMHKDAHFSGSFPSMIDYYQKDGKGVMEEFSIARIIELFDIEQEKQTFLSDQILTDDEKKRVIQSKVKYASLKKVYDLEAKPPQLLADLVLSEDFEAEEEIGAIIDCPEVAPLLIRLIQDDDFYDPLFPGYGLAPLHAIDALAIIKPKEAIIPLFEALTKTEFFAEESVMHALFSIGDPAKEFLLQVAQKEPFTKDNENAAIALLLFREDPLVQARCVDLLTKEAVQKHPTLFTYLLLVCENIQERSLQKKLVDVTCSSLLTGQQKEELGWIVRSFAKNESK